MYDAIVLLSGGQDSTTSLYWAKKKFQNILALIIDYGQKHVIEINSAIKIAQLAEVDYRFFDLGFIKEIGNSALVNDMSNDYKMFLKHPSNSELPISFVPGRNLIFITVASMFAYKYNASNVVTGVCQTDYSGYPDCRDNTITSLEKSIKLGMDFPMLEILTPLMYKTKKETVKMAIELDGCMEALKYSHTCYNGQNLPCMKCPSCLLRAKGFKEAGIIDPILEVKNGI